MVILQGRTIATCFFCGTFIFIIKTLNEDSHCSVKGDEITVKISKVKGFILSGAVLLESFSYQVFENFMVE